MRVQFFGSSGREVDRPIVRPPDRPIAPCDYQVMGYLAVRPHLAGGLVVPFVILRSCAVA